MHAPPPSDPELAPPFALIEAPDAPWLTYLSRHKVHVDCYVPTARGDSEHFRVLNHFSEPPPLMASTEELLDAASEYDLILTYSPEVLRRADHARFMPFGSCWVPRGVLIRNEDASFIFSEGGASVWALPGYDQRAEVLARLQAEDAPTVHLYYGTRRPMRSTSRAHLGRLFERGYNPVPLTAEKLPAFESRYQIVIENVTAENWFTEKLLDCFARKVTPIYIGCPNIGDFFDPAGIVHCRSVDEVFERLNAIRDGARLFDDRAIEANYELVTYYSETRARARDLIEAAIVQRNYEPLGTHPARKPGASQEAALPPSIAPLTHDPVALKAQADSLGPWGHSYEIAPGVWTMENEPFLNWRVEAFAEAIPRLGVPVAGSRILDLACLDGLFCVEFAKRGAITHGVDIRPDNLARAQFGARANGLTNASFELSDVLDLSRDRNGVFDVTLCCGLFYHLTAEDCLKLLRIMRKMTKQLCFLDTHIAFETHVVAGGYPLSEPRSAFVDGAEYRGRLYTEFAPETSMDVRMSMVSSSVNNDTSFWFTRPSLEQAITRSGFRMIEELGLNPNLPVDQQSRSVFVLG
jgi:2-polyprenyl-3-methyl-5-hydroxy-6-metoxy-1,4-benzoquinol methylase